MKCTNNSLKKKLICSIMSILIALSLSACGNTSYELPFDANSKVSGFNVVTGEKSDVVPLFAKELVGAGNLGMAFVKSPMFEKRGVDVVAMFDVDENVIGKKVSGISVYAMDELERKLEEYGVHIVILTLPKEYAEEIMERLDGTKVRGVWNFTGKDIGVTKKGMAIENVHIGDSLMALCYEIAKDFE